MPFAFASNGDGFVFYDRTGVSDPREVTLALDALPSPDDLWARYRAWKGLGAAAEEVVLQPFHDDGSGKAPRCSTHSADTIRRGRGYKRHSYGHLRTGE